MRGAGGFLDVLLGVVALAEQKQPEGSRAKFSLERPAFALIQDPRYATMADERDTALARSRSGAKRTLREQVKVRPDERGVFDLLDAHDIDIAEEERPFGEGGILGLRGVLEPFDAHVLDRELAPFAGFALQALLLRALLLLRQPASHLGGVFLEVSDQSRLGEKLPVGPEKGGSAWPTAHRCSHG